VIEGDITQVKADALITAINSGGLWYGGIDGAIQRVSGKMFHNQAANQMPLHDGQVVFAPATLLHNGRFDNVIFVVDELVQPVHRFVRAALDEAESRSLEVISIPTLRTGVMAGNYETREQAVVWLAIAVAEFVRTKPSNVREINIVVYNNTEDKDLLDLILDRVI
jgi:O-acetyl-ADP-ribose deacetylase (regulator of RNase III)